MWLASGISASSDSLRCESIRYEAMWAGNLDAMRLSSGIPEAFSYVGWRFRCYVFGEWNSCSIQLCGLAILIGHGAMWLMSGSRAAFSLASFPGAEEGEEKSDWYTLFAHARNYSKGHVVEVGACTNRRSTVHVNSINRHKKKYFSFCS